MATKIEINGSIRIPLPLAIFLVTMLVASIVWGVRLEGRINTLESKLENTTEQFRQERTERRLTTVDMNDVLQRLSRLEGTNEQRQ